MLEAQLSGHTNLVDWTLSGTYDPQAEILLDADDPTRSITKRRAEKLVSSLVGAFEPDTTVCLHLANDVTYPLLVLGILASRCRWTGTNTVYTSHELAHHFRASHTRYVVVDNEQLDTVKTAVGASDPSIEIILFTDILATTKVETQSDSAGAAGSMHTVADLMQTPDPARLRECLSRIDENDSAALMSTSGTTGLPKMAARTHRAMMLETAAIQDDNASKPYPIRRLMSTPIFHAFTTPEVVFNPLRLGYPTYIMKRFDSTFAQKIHDLHITETAAAPPALKRLADTPADHHLLHSLRQVFCGGAPLASAERTRFLDLFPAGAAPRIVQVWGMTEGGWFTTFRSPEDDATGSVGRAIPGYRIRVRPTGTLALENCNANDTAPVGELLIQGPQLMSHYFANPAATSATLDADGWLATGDLGHIAPDGRVYVRDRIKDLIKVHAFQVAPAELEQALLQCPLVADAGVCAAGSGNEEHPALFVVPRDERVGAEEVKAWLAGWLASYKVKYAEVIVVEGIPKSATGKVLRKELRRMVEEREAEGGQE